MYKIITKKERRKRLLKVLSVECSIMVGLASVTCALLYIWLGAGFISTHFATTLGFVIGLTAFAASIKQEKILQKINLQWFLVVFSAWYGLLFFCFLSFLGGFKFLCLAIWSAGIFILTAYLGIKYKQKIKRAKIRRLCILLVAIGIICEFITLVMGYKSYFISFSLVASMAMLNLADFSKFDSIADNMATSYLGKNADLYLAWTMFINLSGCFFISDATRLLLKIHLYKQLNKITEPKKYIYV